MRQKVYAITPRFVLVEKIPKYIRDSDFAKGVAPNSFYFFVNEKMIVYVYQHIQICCIAPISERLYKLFRINGFSGGENMAQIARGDLHILYSTVVSFNPRLIEDDTIYGRNNMKLFIEHFQRMQRTIKELSNYRENDIGDKIRNFSLVLTKEREDLKQSILSRYSLPEIPKEQKDLQYYNSPRT